MKTLQLLAAVIILTILSSCESKTFLRSKKKLNSDLQGYWQPVYGTSSYGSNAYNNNLLWRFADGEVFIIRVDDKGVDVPIDNGHYSIEAKIDDDYLTISDFKSPEYMNNGFNLKWDIINLDKGSLSISGKPNNSGRVGIDFTKTEH